MWLSIKLLSPTQLLSALSSELSAVSSPYPTALCHRSWLADDIIFSSTANSKTIDDDDSIAFMGRWSYATDSAGNSMHISNTAGDRALTTFVGKCLPLVCHQRLILSLI
jgi:hypothetical protein